VPVGGLALCQFGSPSAPPAVTIEEAGRVESLPDLFRLLHRSPILAECFGRMKGTSDRLCRSQRHASGFNLRQRRGEGSLPYVLALYS
jgi:hypothetical protein